MKKYSYNCGRPVEKFVVPTLAETINLFDRIRKSGMVFRADFVKRTTGETRTMICRCGVKKYLKGGKAAYNFGEKGLLPVYDWNRQGYRSIPIDNIYCIKFGGIVYWLNVDHVLEYGQYPVDLFNDIEEGRTIPASTSPLLENTKDTVSAF
jgi:hypothetical protein